MRTKYSSNSHSKYLLQFHLIFVCKYRKPLLENNEIADEIKILSKIICLKHNIEIKYVETDKDHIHYLIVFSKTSYRGNKITISPESSFFPKYFT